MIYPPSEDSYLLQKWVKKYAKDKVVLDMGTGSGIQAETALNYTKEVLASDINPKVIKFVKNKGIQTIQSDLFSNIIDKFDLIIFNPPYLPEDINEPEDSKLITTGGIKGCEIIERFLAQAKNHLTKGGKVLLLFSSLSNLDLNKFNYKYKLLDLLKLSFEELYVYLLWE